MRGTSTTVKKEQSNEPTDSVTCINTELSYPFFSYDNSDSKEMKIVVTFSDSVIDSISLAYTLNYSDSSLVATSDNINENNLGASAQKDGLSAKPLNAHFSKMTNALKMSLYAKSSDITNVSKKYLLLSSLTDDYSRGAVIQSYINQGFTCE